MISYLKKLPTDLNRIKKEEQIIINHTRKYFSLHGDFFFDNSSLVLTLIFKPKKGKLIYLEIKKESEFVIDFRISFEKIYTDLNLDKKRTRLYAIVNRNLVNIYDDINLNLKNINYYYNKR